MAKKKHNSSTPDDLDNARQSMKESIESQSTGTSASDDDSDNTQEPPNVESEGSRSSSSEMETPIEEPETSPGNGVLRERILMTLYKLVYKGDWDHVKRYLELHPDALTAQISSNGGTALHIAVLGGHVKIVEELVHMISAEELTLPTKTGETTLSLAAGGGITKVAKPLVRKNHDLLGKKNKKDNIPVVVAAQFGHVDMVHFLYWVTQEEDLDPETSNQNQGGKLLTACIVAQIYEIPRIGYCRRNTKYIGYPTISIRKWNTIGVLETMDLLMWIFFLDYKNIDQVLLKGMPVHSPRICKTHRDIEAHAGISIDQENIIKQALNHLYGLVWDLLKFFAPCLKHIHDVKVKHVQVREFLGCVSKEISALNHSEIHSSKLFPSVFDAVKHRNFEFVEEILTAYPDMVWILDEEDRNIFLFAVLQREEKIFCLLHEMGPRKNLIATSLDRNCNTILHHAAMLSPSSHLDHISGAALQMQRELQWFKEVEKVVQPMYREMRNKEGKTARALFASQHKKMRKQGETWMKETATSCTVVAALIATIMFTSAFTVPGGYDNKTGDPLYLNHEYFMLFIVADALSLFSSASSVLMFLGILKSRYSEDEFLFSLPCKLILGVATLFFSIVTMMLTFATTIYIVLHDRLSWIGIPIVLFSGIPIMIFTFPQVPLMYEICASTFGPGIFARPKKHYR
ncbi:hypothetical protein Vadar_014411 [Vaccinium darrowii]|uniref:Uncharacterized protein n=1 Tax=Vaccinium darrowii TaxID=229202 RepID=A0ACB7YEN0_9ERIC|nr:hypothetical protein Vadar_014411 [Vaccinium darrowii]